MQKRLGIEQRFEHVSTRAAREITGERFAAQEPDGARNIDAAPTCIAPRDSAAQLVIRKNFRHGRGDIDHRICCQGYDALHACRMLLRHRVPGSDLAQLNACQGDQEQKE